MSQDKFWSLSDELELLNAIGTCGYGNWEEISNKLPHFSPSECEQHYLDKFANDIYTEVERQFPLCSSNCKTIVKTPNEPYLNCLEIMEMNNYIRNLEDRNFKALNKHFPVSEIKSNEDRFLNYMIALPYVGYNRIRSDFTIEYDNGAESILRMIAKNDFKPGDLDDDEKKLFEEMGFVLCQSYNSRLKERNYRKRIVRDHCLIDRRKAFTTLQRLDVAFGRTTLKATIPLIRFMNGPEFDFLIEKLKYQNELRLKMHLFIEYRNNGMKFLNDIDTYKRLNNKRMKYNAELSCFNVPSNADLRLPVLHGNRKPVTPLALGHLPGYNLLNEDEKKLCSTSRIVPETYNSFKEVLITECEKRNGLRLAQARNLIKIDVNKTRKMYDYLMSINLIWLPET